MKYVSTRNKDLSVNFAEALVAGIAPDGGLFVPQVWPQVDIGSLAKIDNYADFASQVLQRFVGDCFSEVELQKICKQAFNFPIPVVMLKNRTAVLELFHGPTSAFKDVGARFLAACMAQLLESKSSSKRNIVLVATSGDTGGAVASAFLGKKNIEVKILFPEGRISQRQEKQLTAWGQNVSAIAVAGSFDQCQTLVKQSLVDNELKKNINFISANSINLGRILPQMIYYAYASLQYQKNFHSSPGFIIPSGNLGNSLAAVWAKRLGFPIREIVLATNANKTVLNYAKTGVYKPEPTQFTLANAMDVGNPSNMERYLDLLSYEDFKKSIRVVAVEDEQIQQIIRQGERDWQQIWCPHTATAVYAREQQKTADWIIVATAHPAKFETIVEPLIGHTVEVPTELNKIMQQASHVVRIKPDFVELVRVLN